MPPKSKQDIKISKAPLDTDRSISIEESVDSSTISDAESSKTLDQINSDIMKSIESMDTIGIGTNENMSTTDSLSLPENTQGGESDQESKTDSSASAVKNSDAALGDLKDHGVVSLHYPEEDANSVYSLDVEDNDPVC